MKKYSVYINKVSKLYLGDLKITNKIFIQCILLKKINSKVSCIMKNVNISMSIDPNVVKIEL